MHEAVIIPLVIAQRARLRLLETRLFHIPPQAAVCRGLQNQPFICKLTLEKQGDICYKYNVMLCPWCPARQTRGHGAKTKEI